MIWQFLLHFTGSDIPGSRWNLFWSGFGSGPIAWCLLPAIYLRHHNCHEPWCLRLGRHQHPDGTKFCRKHHQLRRDQS